MKTLKQLKEERALALGKMEELRTAADNRAMSEEESRSWDDMDAEIRRIDAEIAREERFQQVSASAAIEEHEERTQQTADEEQRSAYCEFARGGAASMSTEQKRAVNIVNGTATVPTSMAKEIEKAMKAYGGVMAAAHLITTTDGGDYNLPVVNDTNSKAKIVKSGVQDTSDTKSLKIEAKTLRAHTYRTAPAILPYEILQDSNFNLEAEIVTLLSDSFGRGFNADLTNGTGTDMPQGIVTGAVDCGFKAAIDSVTYDDIVKLMASVDSAYAEKGSFMMNYNTYLMLALIKDDNGRPILHNDPTAAVKQTILGKPVMINNDMKSMGAGNTSILFGDMSKYKVRLVLDFKTIRLQETYADYLSIGLLGFGRGDGLLLDAGTNPIKKLTHSLT